MAEPVALATLAVDALIGWPAPIYRRIGHPVGGFARLIDACERRWNRTDASSGRRQGFGILTIIVLIGLTVAVCIVITAALNVLFGAHAWMSIVLVAAPALAQRSLYQHVLPVAAALRAGDLGAARVSVARIVGRDVRALDEAGVARAALESLAESFCDGVVAPLFWLIVAGLPGIWAYKAVNTADSMIGHREERWRTFGWAAAQIDDAANFVPARLAGILLCTAGWGGWRTFWRDGHKHASPNAGRPEAAMAGALGVRLAGPVVYDGVSVDKPWIGSGRADAGAADVRRGLAVYLRACFLLWCIAGAVVWLR